MNGKIAVMLEEVSLVGEDINFVAEFPLVTDLEFTRQLINNRESSFPTFMSGEVGARICPFENPGQKLHSWIRVFGVQSALLRYKEWSDHNEEVVRSVLDLIRVMDKVRHDGKRTMENRSEPRLIFWFENEKTKEA